MSVIQANLTPARVAAIIAAVPAIVAGSQQGVGGAALSADVTEAVKQIQLAVGTMALSIIKDAFLVKSRGGSDAAGITWKPLDPRYVAYGRRHPGLKRKKAGERPIGLLTDSQDDRWRRLFGAVYHRLRASGSSEADAKSNAAAHAWTVLKGEGAKTILSEYGGAPVEIGRDTGRMFNGLTMGIDPNQAGRVIIAANTKYAAAFHAKRPMWPETDADWPTAWIDQLEDVLTDGIVVVCRRLLSAA